MGPPRSASADQFLRTADDIACRISRLAIFHEDRCTWIGADPFDQRDPAFHSGLTYRTLGSDLYCGTSGVSLFLAELFSVTSDSELRRVALAAIRQALARLDSVSAGPRLGFFTGWTGIAFVAVRVALLLDDTRLLRQGIDLLRRALSEQRQKDDFDVMSGRAGAVAGLLVLSHILADSSLLECASDLGDELLLSADRTDVGVSWASAGPEKHRNLTGFSHGAAGAGYALLELFHATGIAKYREAGLEAFRYERHWFDARVGNWPDFRADIPTSRRGSGHRSGVSFWCHGAPGIALSRLRAFEILGDEVCKAEAIVALARTRETLEVALAAGTGNFSICHGLAGNAEVLVYGTELLKSELGRAAEIPFKIANFGVARYSSGGAPWPCGTHAGETPGFMLGLAGIGHHYLRLHRPSIPSILILRKEVWREAG